MTGRPDGRRGAILVRAGAAVLALSTAACAEPYLAHRETLSPTSGDAIAADLAKEVIDPWPKAAFQEGLTTSGERLQHAMERYNNPSSGQNPGLVTPVSPIPVVR